MRVPATNLLAGEGDGFMIAQARLGPGRIHHCMRAIGMAERALALMVRAGEVPGRVRPPAGRAGHSSASDRRVADGDRAGAAAACSRPPDLIDKFGAKGARTEIAAIKVIAPKVALDVIDRAIQVHGGAGVSDDTRSPASTPARARCGSPTAPTRCTSAAWPSEELARERPYCG